MLPARCCANSRALAEMIFGRGAKSTHTHLAGVGHWGERGGESTQSDLARIDHGDGGNNKETH
jgi:hypothetical protein